MKRKPVIGIIPTFNKDYPNFDPYLDITYFVRLYADKIEECGGIPIGITTTNPSNYTSICDGYLWPGGYKVNHDYYPLIEDAIKNKKPFLGICLGSQAMSIYFNMLEDSLKHPGKLLKDVYDINKVDNPYLVKVADSEFHKRQVRRDSKIVNAAKHEVEIIDKDSFIYNIYKSDKINMVSLHTSCINRVPKDLKITAKYQEVIEAIEYHKDGSKILGVQFHPEILDDTKIFEWLINNCNKE